MNAMAPIQRVLLGYGSESGTARALARRLETHPALRDHAPQLLPLNDIDVAQLGHGDVLLAVASSFGDGEPPANGERFYAALRQAPSLQGLRYAVFGLGDTGYPRFCGFTKALDALLGEHHALPLLQRVDADACYPAFFDRWAPALGEVLAGDGTAAQDLCLQVTAYGQDHAFSAAIVARERLNQSDPAAWHITLDLTGSGIAYQAGDTLHVIPDNDPVLLQALADWYGDPEAALQLADRELRLPGRAVLREIARLGGSEPLKLLLKSSQRAALEAYLHGHDLLDILQDHASPDTLPLDRLIALLSPCLPRAYSIASAAGQTQVALCVREVRYVRRGRERRGAGTGSLLQGSGTVRVYCRANPGFRLPDDPDCPVLLIGTGTGIAPLMGLIQEMAAGNPRRDVCLVFGEKHRAEDFLYRTQLEAWQQDGRLTTLLTAFSRDGQAKYYVQDAIGEHAAQIGAWLERGAHLYLCGNRRHLESAVRGAIDDIATDAGSHNGWEALTAQGRLHCELY
ncbi:flavodoxin domain-containing protein [Stenotrophomonas sp. GZD-301]|uniref:flavodoxin domain-containing protein n=1 Tax=Stenotrophomonas sp. GZD-301 TaxID=3404814 RepID=UPI003BB8003D